MAHSASSPQSPNLFFAKTFEVAKATPIGDHRLSTATNSIQKVPSLSTMRSSRLFGKESMFSTFSNTSKERSKSMAFKKVPRVEIQAIIKKKADKYFDESLAKSVDELLETGYTMVLNRKNHKQELKNEQEELNEAIGEVEREILPEMNRLFVLKENLKAAKEQQAKFIEGVEYYEQEIKKTNQIIEDRRNEIEAAQQNYMQVIQEINTNIQQIRNEIIVSKDNHKTEIEKLKLDIKNHQAEKGTLNDELANLKAQYEKVKNSQGDKKRKIENKSRMFLGLLKH